VLDFKSSSHQCDALPRQFGVAPLLVDLPARDDRGQRFRVTGGELVFPPSLLVSIPPLVGEAASQVPQTPKISLLEFPGPERLGR